jgi:hypothetical protein
MTENEATQAGAGVRSNNVIDKLWLSSRWHKHDR